MTGHVAQPGRESVAVLIADGAKSDNDNLKPLLAWVADQRDRPNIVIVCAHETKPVPASNDAMVVRLNGCAAELSLASYLELAASGVANLTVLAPSCAMIERIETTVAAANQLLRACPGVCVITLESRHQSRKGRAFTYDLRRLPVSRRRLLFLGRLDHSWVPNVHADQRARAVVALSRLTPDGSLPGALGEVFALRSPRRDRMFSVWRVREGMPDGGVATQAVRERSRYLHADLSVVAVY